MKQLLLEKMEKVFLNLMNLKDVAAELADSEKTDDELEKIGIFRRDFGMEQWDWPQGVGLFGLSKAKDHLSTIDYENYMKNWFEKRLKQGLPCKNINTTAPLLTLMDFDFAENLSHEWMDWVDNGSTRTNERGLQHDVTARNIRYLTVNHQEIWIDTLVMTNLFIAKMGVKYDNDAWKNEAIYQLLLHTKYLSDKKTNLFFHGWSFERNDNFGNVLWCRGNCWATISIPLTLEILKGSIPAGVKDHLLNYYHNQVDALLQNYLDQDEMMWRTVLTNPKSYIETSGTAGILAGIYLGIKHGYLETEKYLGIANQILEKVLLRIDEDGVVTNVSAGTPIQMTEQEYMDIVTAPMGYGQAMVLLLLSVAIEFHS